MNDYGEWFWFENPQVFFIISIVKILMNSTFCRLNILYFIQAQHLNLLTTIKLTFQKSKGFDFKNEGTLTLTRSIIPFSRVEQIDAIDNYKNIIVVTRIVFYPNSCRWPFTPSFLQETRPPSACHLDRST